jgi:hypothetical protein
VLESDTFGRVEVGGEERADTGKVVGSPVLQESSGFGGDVPLGWASGGRRVPIEVRDWGGAGYWPCPRLAPRRLTGSPLRR